VARALTELALHPLDVAESAVRLSAERPHEARDLAGPVAADARSSPEVRAVAERALGLAARQLGDMEAAEAHLRRALAAAAGAGLRVREGEVRLSLSGVLALVGATGPALQQARRASALLSGADRGRALAQRAVILQRAGRHQESLAVSRDALAVFRRTGDAEAEAKVLSNRAILHAYLGDLRSADTELRRAAACNERLGLELATADARHNLGFVAARSGDVPTALSCYDAAADSYRRLGAVRPMTLLDRGEALLAVRLVAEARRLMARALLELEERGMRADLAEARVMAAQAALLDGDHAEATAMAEEAGREFTEQDRPGWAAVAAYAALRARWLADDLDDVDVAAAVALAPRLDGFGWAAAAADVRLIVARHALRAGDLERAEGFLEAASQARHAGPADLRARAWHAEALLRLARGDQRGASSALRAGLRVIRQHQATLGATELRVHAAARADELAAEGLDLALTSRRPGRVLQWAELWRAGTLQLRPARPPADERVADALTALRRAVADVEEAALAGQDATRALRRQAGLEATIRRLTRHAPGEGDTTADLATVGALADALGTAALVELVERGGALHAVTVVDGRARLHDLGPAPAAWREVQALRFALQRMGRGRGSAASTSAAAASATHAAECLDQLLLRPLRPVIGDRPLVIVPTGPLHGVGWAALPSCRGRPVAVTPSATRWLVATAAATAPRLGPTVVVAGPNLAHAADEVADVARTHAGAITLPPAGASVERVRAAIDGADLAHVAAHGTFRSDNPLFSSLHLADGPLTVYDLEALREAPRRMVLSACESGLAAVTGGDQMLGLAAALFDLGTETLVASIAQVPDAATRRLMVAFHRRLAAGAGPATALAQAQAALDPEGEDLAAAAGFVCFGAG
jgi:tetratricopeptide (TPR) repeat protein